MNTFFSQASRSGCQEGDQTQGIIEHVFLLRMKQFCV